MQRHHQLRIPPMEVQAVNPPVNRSSAAAVNSPVKTVNPLRWVREALKRARLSQTYFASALGISEPLVSAQLSEHNPDKHLSLRRMGGVDDVSFWREFCLLCLEDLGFRVVIMTPEQYEAHEHLVASANQYARASASAQLQRVNAL
jgi:transcriptional regulator with XRE-family HTH domain